MQENRKVSVVIPTLGTASIEHTITALNSGSLVPEEILICLPQNSNAALEHLVDNNVIIVHTSVRGQVAQRAYGFGLAKSYLVLQIDDDIIVEENCLEILVDFISSCSTDASIAPSLFCNDTGQSFYKKPSAKLGLLYFYYWLLNSRKGYQPGTLTQAGTNIGIDPSKEVRDIVQVEWVPGGCLLHKRDKLVLNNFYKFPGKAYSEDLFHSLELTRNNVSLYVSTKAICYLDAEPTKAYSFSEYCTYIQRDYVARSHLVRILNKSKARMNVFYFISILRYLTSKALG